MSERILKALIKLFAIIARVDPYQTEGTLNGRQIVESFLKERLPSKLSHEYMLLFEEYLETYQKISTIKDGKQKRTSVNSVRLLRICTEINEELTQRQKTIVLIRLLEFIHSHDEVTYLEQDFINTVAETFNFDMDEYKLARLFVEGHEEELKGSPNVMSITDGKVPNSDYSKRFISYGMEGSIHILRIPSINLHFFKYRGEGTYNISGQTVYNNRFYVLNQGASIRGSKIKPIYYSDIIGTFLQDENQERISFQANGVEYKFPRGNMGLHKINLNEESGHLVGIMGSSGSGKSTML